MPPFKLVHEYAQGLPAIKKREDRDKPKFKSLGNHDGRYKKEASSQDETNSEKKKDNPASVRSFSIRRALVFSFREKSGEPLLFTLRVRRFFVMKEHLTIFAKGIFNFIWETTLRAKFNIFELHAFSLPEAIRSDYSRGFIP